MKKLLPCALRKRDLKSDLVSERERVPLFHEYLCSHLGVLGRNELAIIKKHPWYNMDKQQRSGFRQNNCSEKFGKYLGSLRFEHRF